MTQAEKVTLKDVYAVVNRLEDKMDENLKSLNGRVDEVEKKQANMEGKTSVISFVVSAGISIIGAFIQRGGH